MNVQTGIGAGEVRAEFGGEVLFDAAPTGRLTLGVGAAEVSVGGGHAALASVGEFEVAEVEGVVLPSRSHEKSVAMAYYVVNVLVFYQWTQFVLAFE